MPGGPSHTEPEEVRLEVQGVGMLLLFAAAHEQQGTSKTPPKVGH